MNRLPKPEDHRKPEHNTESLFWKRWSPRSMTGEGITEAEMMSLFEAARWAPLTYNEQEWRFLYARRDTPQWSVLFELLAEGNRMWCKNAALLCVIVAHKFLHRTGKPNPVHIFDCGAAFENLALQGTSMGLVVHGMQGFDFEKTRTSLGVPEDFAIAAMFAVGRPGDPEQLPPDYRKIEVPSGRKHVREFVCEGRFAF